MSVGSFPKEKRRTEQWGATRHITDSGTIWSAWTLTSQGKLCEYRVYLQILLSEYDKNLWFNVEFFLFIVDNFEVTEYTKLEVGSEIVLEEK